MSTPTHTKQFNLQRYLFDITFLPYGSEPVKINPDAVIHLVLEEELLNWNTKGFIIIENSHEIFQRATTAQVLNNSRLKAKEKRDIPKDGYIFRNDGKDRIHIKIKPLNFSNNPEYIEIPDKGWLIDFKCTIYDFEEPMVQEFGSKIKKLYFWDEDWQKLIERNTFNSENGIFSTATSKLNPNNKDSKFDPAQATDEQRTMFTGDAIKDILQNTLNFEIDEDNFDKGKSKIFYTSPTGSNCLDTINYLWHNHLSEVLLPSGSYDLSLLLKNRDTKKYEFTSLSKIFQKAGVVVDAPGEYQIEHLILENIGQNEQEENQKQPATNWMAPILLKYDPEYQKDVKISKLQKYSFAEMSAVDSMRSVVSRSVFVYDRKNKTFSKNTSKSQITDLHDNLQNDYINDKFLIKGNQNVQINLNQVKSKNLKTQHVITPIVSENVVERLGHVDLMLKSILFNSALTIELPGSTNRRVARFIGVDRYDFNDTEFDYTLGGQWLTTKVKHNFYRNNYINEVQLIKHQVYNKIVFNKDESVT